MTEFALESVRLLRAPNVHAPFRVLEAEVNHGGEPCLLALPPVLEPAERTLAGAIAELVVGFQRRFGLKVAFHKAYPSGREGWWTLLAQFEDDELVRPCLDAALRAIAAIDSGLPFDLPRELAVLEDISDRVTLGPSTRAIVSEALARGIPARRLNTGSLILLGQGRRQRRIWTAETDRTSAIAETIAGNKQLTKRLLASVGVPVPEGQAVSSAQQAVEVASRLGGAVVVKPLDANHARGVFIGLSEDRDIRHAFEEASKEGNGVLVERYLPGGEHRVLVVNGEIVAAARGDALYAPADGRMTIQEIIDHLNSDPRRGFSDDCPLDPVEINPVTLSVLARQGFSLDSVPAAGVRVLFRHSGNHAADVTDEIHPVNAAAIILAARTIGLDIAGIDVVVEDIGRPMAPQGGGIVEVNSSPGLQMHLQPASGPPRPVGEKIFNTLFAPGETGRIPIVTVEEGASADSVAGLIHRMLTASGIETGRAAGPDAGALTLHPLLDALVASTSSSEIRDFGLAIDRSDVVVLPGGGALEPRRLLAASATTALVIAAGAADSAQLIPSTPGEVILVAENEEHPGLTTHRRRGGRAVFVRDGKVMGAAKDGTGLDLGPDPRGEAGLLALAARWALEPLLPALSPSGHAA